MTDDHTDQQAMSEALERGEQFTRIFVGPMIAAMREELKTHTANVEAKMGATLETVSGFEGRVKKIESNQKKAMIGYSAYATVLSGAGIAVWAWVKGHLGVKIG